MSNLKKDKKIGLIYPELSILFFIGIESLNWFKNKNIKFNPGLFKEKNE